jgi:hypothetical protein
MEVTGVENKKSTPESRKRKRDQAVAIGDLQNFISQQPFLVVYAVAGLFAAGFIEKMI